MKKMVLIAIGSLILSANEASDIPYIVAAQKAKHVAHELQVKIKGDVAKKIRNDGVLSAVKFCIDESYQLTQDLNKELGNDISIKRVSLLNRNPKSFPQKDEEMILKAFDLLEKSNVLLQTQIVQPTEDGGYKVYLPSIMSGKNCKLCHGVKENIDSKVLSVIENKYPNDKAFGFTSGQVRGAIIVEIKQNEKNKSDSKEIK